jgi:hypothetical protein
MSAAIGGFVSDGQKLADAIQRLAKLAAEKDANFPGIDFDSESYQGVSLHKAAIPLRRGNDQVRSVLGDPMSVILGTGAESVYVAFGQDAEKLLKDVLDGSLEKSEQKLPPSELRLSLQPALEFAAAAEQNQVVEAALAAVKAYEGGDSISLSVEPFERGCAVRLEVEEGVLKAIGGAVKARNQRRQP